MLVNGHGSIDNVVFVTGGASGIGRAVVKEVLERGWRAIAADRDEALLEVVQEDLSSYGDALRVERLDVTDENAVRDCVGRCERDFGPISGVVNSAGIGEIVPTLDTSLDMFRRIYEVNVFGMFAVCREVAVHMRDRSAGSIVNIGSVSGLRANAGRVAYGSSKGAVHLMTQVLAVDLAPFGIRANCIAPGAIETPLNHAVFSPEQRSAVLALVPQGRYAVPAEVAQASIFLLDDARSAYVTGQTIAVDGGLSAAGVLPFESRKLATAVVDGVQ